MVPSTPEDSSREPAPPQVETVRAVLNTLDLEGAIDDWSTPEATLRWLYDRDIVCSDDCADLSEADLDRLRAFREALRDFVQFGGAGLPAGSRGLMEREMARCPLVLTFCGDDGGDVRLTPAGRQVDAAVAWILATIREAQLAGFWDRLRICESDTCRWAFYDHSRNASSRWCSMASCGNRAKARRHRARLASRSA